LHEPLVMRDQVSESRKLRSFSERVG
jgi:hypothetical protein